MTQASNISENSGKTQNKSIPPFTYNEGEGVKDQIVMTGPLSEVLARAMNVFFEKKPLTATPESPEVDMPATPVVESYSQDQVIEAMVASMQGDQGLELVLDNFNVASIQEHMQKVESGEIANEPNTPAPTAIYVTDANDLVTSTTAEDLLSRSGGSNGALVVVIQDVGNKGEVQPAEMTDTLAMKEEEAAEVHASIERLYEGTGVTVCWGVEALCSHLLVKKLGAFAAQEGLTDKMKDGLKKIIESIKHTVKAFAETFSNKKKTLLEEIDSAISLCGGRSSDATLDMQSNWSHLVRNNKLTGKDAVTVGDELHELCSLSRKFITESFSDTKEAAQVVRSFKANFKKFVLPKRADAKLVDAEYQLFKDINGEQFDIVLLVQTPDMKKRGYHKPFASSRGATALTTKVKLPSSCQIKNDEMLGLLKTARKVVLNASEEIDKLGHVLDSLDSEMFGPDPDMPFTDETEIFRSYSNLIYQLLNCVFKESLNFGEASVSLAKAYAKAAK